MLSGIDPSVDLVDLVSSFFFEAVHDPSNRYRIVLITSHLLYTFFSATHRSISASFLNFFPTKFFKRHILSCEVELVIPFFRFKTILVDKTSVTGIPLCHNFGNVVRTEGNTDYIFVDGGVTEGRSWGYENYGDI